MISIKPPNPRRLGGRHGRRSKPGRAVHAYSAQQIHYFGLSGMASRLDIEACQVLCEIGRLSKAGGTTNFKRGYEDWYTATQF